MPIVVPRTGAISAPAEDAISDEQRQRLWEAIVKNWAEKNKDLLRSEERSDIDG